MSDADNGSELRQQNANNVKRRKFLRLGSLAATISGASTLSLGAIKTSPAVAAPPDRNTTQYVPLIEKGAASGVATLDSSARIPKTQIPDLSDTYASKLDGSFNVKMAPYHAQGDGKSVDRIAIQNAINDAHAMYASSGTKQTVVIPPGVFLVDAINYARDDGSIFGATSLKLLDGVNLIGTGLIRVKSNAYGAGAFYRVLSSRDSGLSDATISGITIDGNRAAQAPSTQCSNIVLEALSNVSIVNVSSLHANGNGIMIRGTTSRAAANLNITGNTVVDATGIGIQASQFDGLIITNNYINSTGNNCIDIYGECGSNTPNARNFRITSNTVQNGLVGIFPETCRDGVVTGNNISRCSIGIGINRINGQPSGIISLSNTISDCSIGVRVTGDTGGIQIRSNFIRGFNVTGVQLGGGDGNISKVTVEGNDLQPSATATLIMIAGAQAAWLRVRNNSTSSSDRSRDVENSASVNVDNLVEPPYCDQKIDRDQSITVTKIPVASGASFQVPIPPNTGGVLTIKGTAGGAWQSVWVGVVSAGSAGVAVAQSATIFNPPGNAIAKVIGSSSSPTVTVTAASSGSAGLFGWTYRYF